MEREIDYDNDRLDQSEKYFRKKIIGNDNNNYFSPEVSELNHY